MNIIKSVTVITPTIGSIKVLDAIKSVQNQTYENLTHLLVIDGPEYIEAFQKLQVPLQVDTPITLTCSPFNTGANGFYGHRIYSAYPHLIDSDYISFLDEDNWYEPEHIESLVDTIESTGSDWVHSLRSVHAPDGSFAIADKCESLGKYPIYGDERNGYLVDTSSYLFKRSWLIQNCQLWHSGWGADRNFFNLIRGGSRWQGTGRHTLCYRLDGNPGSPKIDFFIKGNEITSAKYAGVMPWTKK